MGSVCDTSPIFEQQQLRRFVYDATFISYSVRDGTERNQIKIVGWNIWRVSPITLQTVQHHRGDGTTCGMLKYRNSTNILIESSFE